MSTKIDAFFSEFPFLGGHFNPSKLDTARTVRLNIERLGDQRDSGCKILFFNSEGQLITTAKYWSRKTPWYRKIPNPFSDYKPGESMKDVGERIGTHLAREVTFIARLDMSYKSRHLVLFKMPREQPTFFAVLYLATQLESIEFEKATNEFRTT